MYRLILSVPSPPSPSILNTHPSSVPFPPSPSHYSSLIRPFSSLSFYTHYSSLIRPFSSLSFYSQYSSLIRPFSSLSFYTHYSSPTPPVPSPPSPSILITHPSSVPSSSLSFLSSNTHPSSLPLSPSPPILILNPSILLLILILLPFLLHPLSTLILILQIHIRPIYYFSSFFLYEYSFTPSSIHSFIFISLSTFLPFFNRSFFPHIPPPVSNSLASSLYHFTC